MNKDYFKDIYKDFFDTESIPKIEVKEMPNDEDMASLFDRINALNVDDKSKELIKRILEYMRLFKEGTETNYIPFRIVLETNNKLLEEELTDILSTAGSFYNYIDKSRQEISLYKIEDIKDTGLLLINNLNGINLEESKTSKKFIHSLTEYLDKARSILLKDEKGVDGIPGGDKDGVVEIRRGCKDLDLGNSRYAQVRILVDGDKYIKAAAETIKNVFGKYSKY